MKYSILFLLIFCTVSVFSQNTKEENLYNNEPIAFVTSKKDTLYLVNDNLGKTIARSWEGKYYIPERDGPKPCILLVEISYIRHRLKNVKVIEVKAESKKFLTKTEGKQ